MRTIILALTLAVVVFAALAGAHLDHDSWPQWGGQLQDFQAHAADLATSWGESGPPELWRRELGDGNSAITVKGRRLFTMYRRGSDEVVVALERETGKTLWERSWPANPWPGFFAEYGHGPHSTPLATGDRVYAAGIAGRLVCLDIGSGEIVWERDLWEGYDKNPEDAGPASIGYSASPLLHRHMVIAAGGAPSRSVMALHRDTGETIWEADGYEPAFASPILIDVGGQMQIVLFAVDIAFGLDAETGERLWEHEHKTSYKVNATTPLWDGESLLFLSSAYDSGSRALRLTRGDDGKTRVQQLWATREVEVHHQTAVMMDGRIYASSGDFGPAFLTALDPADGSLLFRERGFAKANLLAVGDELLILDEDGTLALARPAGEGLEILARADVFESRSWTVPTLVGTTLYARDRKEIVAFDLGPKG